MASTWRKGYRRKDGTWVKGHRVHGKNPKAGCSFWLLGIFTLAVSLLLLA